MRLILASIVVFASVAYVKATTCGNIITNTNIFVKENEEPYQMVSKANHEECEALCRATAGCEVWKYVSGQAYNNWPRKLCYIGKKNYNDGYQQGVYSGYCNSAHKNTEKKSNCVMTNINLYVKYWYDNFNRRTNIPSYEACAQLCEEDDSCQIWKYISTTSHHYPRETCFYGTYRYNHGSDTGVYSGYKKCNAYYGYQCTSSAQCVAGMGTSFATCGKNGLCACLDGYIYSKDTCVKKAETDCFDHNTRYGVGGYNIKEVEGVASAEKCQEICQGLPKCVAFVYNTQQKFCKPKKSYKKSLTRTAQNFVTGPRKCPA